MSSDDVRMSIPLQCPSAQPEMSLPIVFGVATTRDDERRVAYLEAPIPVTAELLELSGEISPTRIFRFAAACEEHRCQHFDGQRCRLAQRIVQTLPVVVEQLPRCIIRSDCRWYAEEGAAACRRCPQVVTLTDTEDPVLLQVATGFHERTPGGDQ